MSSGVTSIVVARAGARALERTLTALGRSTTAGDRTVVVTVGAAPPLLEVARAAEPDLLVTLPSDASFGDAVDQAVTELDRHAHASLEGWLWLLEAGDEPEPAALGELLASVERNPSLAVTGPKVVLASDPDTIVELGRTQTRDGRAVVLRAGELDQGQFDDRSDVLAVGRSGMLVRAATWAELEGFDPGLGDVDDALDFGTRVWLADGRVTVTPTARLRTAAAGAAPSPRRRRAAQLHRGVAALGSGAAALQRWLLVPAAVLGAFWHFLRKRPGRILPDLAAAWEVASGATRVGEARARFAATSTQPPRVVEQLRVPHDLVRRDRRLAAEASRGDGEGLLSTLLGHGGGWMLLASSVLSVVLLLPLLQGATLAGGALLPLSGDLGTLWSHVGYGVRDHGSGALGVADPFTVVLAVLGTLTFWHPSLSIVILWFLALPLAAFGGWSLAGRWTRRPWWRAFAAFGWMLAPPLLVALQDGRLNVVLVHLLLPAVVGGALDASRSWARAAQGALAAAVVLAAAPQLAPALAVLWLVVLVLARRRLARTALLAMPALALFLPLIVTQLNRGHLAALIADPGVPVAVDALRGAAVATALPDARLGGWAHLLAGAEVAPVLVVAAFLVPLAMLAVLGLVGRGWRLAAWSALLAVLGFTTAGLAGSIAVSTAGPDPVALLAAPGQSLFWFGVVGAALAGLAAGGRVAAAVGLLGLLGVVAVIGPAAVSHHQGVSPVHSGDANGLPAIVAAESRADAGIGTLIITPLADGSMRVRLDRGAGETLDEQSTLGATAIAFSPVEERLANLAVTLASDSTASPTGEFHALGIAYVLLETPTADATQIAQRVGSALDANAQFQAAGDGSAGRVWRVVNATVAPADAQVAGQLQTANLDTWVGRGLLLVQALVVIGVVLLALPTGDAAHAQAPRRRRLLDTAVETPRRVARRVSREDDPERLGAPNNEEDDDGR